jgi:type II secretory ATPase GspE/PulE/Tfp pilus assembly ATPase PilB-like protein
LIASHPYLAELTTIAVEDPSEFDHGEFVDQYSLQRNSDDLDHDVKRKFMSTARTILRQDPDIVIMGETRDEMTMEFVSGMVQTGHLMLTTMHGDGGPDVLARMHYELKVPTSLLGSRKYVRAAGYQKLLPRLCACSDEIDITQALSRAQLDALRKRFRLDLSKIRCANPIGCEKCNRPGIPSAGIAGLTVAAELVEPDEEIRKLLREGDFAGVRRVWRAKRKAAFDEPDTTGKTAFEHAIYKVSQGLVDPRDVEREFGPLATFDLDEDSQ